MNENETTPDVDETTESSNVLRKVLIVSAAAAGLIIAGGFAHFRNKTNAEMDENTDADTTTE